MVTVELFGVQLEASLIALLVVIVVTFLLCAGAALAIGRISHLRFGAVTIALGGGTILFALVVVGAAWFGYYALSSSQ